MDDLAETAARLKRKSTVDAQDVEHQSEGSARSARRVGSARSLGSGRASICSARNSWASRMAYRRATTDSIGTIVSTPRGEDKVERKMSLMEVKSLDDLLDTVMSARSYTSARSQSARSTGVFSIATPRVAPSATIEKLRATMTQDEIRTHVRERRVSNQKRRLSVTEHADDGCEMICSRTVEEPCCPQVVQHHPMYQKYCGSALVPLRRGENGEEIDDTGKKKTSSFSNVTELIAVQTSLYIIVQVGMCTTMMKSMIVIVGFQVLGIVAATCAQDGSDYSYVESIAGNVRSITTNHCPNHPFYNINPNTAVMSSTEYMVPASPTYVGFATDSSTSSAHIDLSKKGGGVGLFFSAAFLYSPYGGPIYGQTTNWQTSATHAEGNSFDQCGCHGSSDSEASYHCHVPPPCLLRQLGQSDSVHSPQIGWAFDGFPLYGPRGPGGVMMKTCTQTGGTYGSDVCTDDCGGYYSADGSIDNFVYRYYILGEYNDGTSCDAPTCPSPTKDYFPNTPICFRGCCPSGMSCHSSIRACPTLGTLSGVKFGYSATVPTINSLSLASGLPTNRGGCACDQIACKVPCASSDWSKQTCSPGANSCPGSGADTSTTSKPAETWPSGKTRGGKCAAACTDTKSTACKACNEQAIADFSAKVEDARDKATEAVSACGAKTDQAEKSACYKEKRASLKASTVQPEGLQVTTDQRISRNEILVEFEKSVQAAEKLERTNVVKTKLLNKIKNKEDKAAIETVKEEMCSRCANADGNAEDKRFKTKICIQQCVSEALVDVETEDLTTCYSAASTTNAKSACFCKASANDDQLDEITKQGNTRKVKAALDFICEEYATCTSSGASDCSDKLEAEVTIAKGGCASGTQELKGNSKNVKAMCEKKQVGDVQGRCKLAMEDRVAEANTDEAKIALVKDVNQCLKDATGLPVGKIKKLERDSTENKISEEMIACTTCQEEAAISGVATNCPEKSKCVDLVKAVIKEEYGSDCEGNYQALVQDNLGVAQEDASAMDQVLDVPKTACEVLISFKQGKGQCRLDGTMRAGLKEKMAEKASKVDGVGKAAQKTQQVERTFGKTTVQESIMSLALEAEAAAAEMTEEEIEQKCELLATRLMAGTDRRLAELDTSDLDDVTATQATQSCLASDTSCQSSELNVDDGVTGSYTSGSSDRQGNSLFKLLMLGFFIFMQCSNY